MDAALHFVTLFGSDYRVTCMSSFLRKYIAVLLPLLLLSACGGGSSSGPDLIDCSDSSGIGGQTVSVTCRAGTSSPLTLQWTVTDPQSNAVPVSANGLTASFVPASVGNFKVKLTATAGSDTETESFTVAVTNPPPEVSCPSPVAAKAGREVTVDCSSSDFSGRTLSYAWQLTPPTSSTDTLTTGDAEDAVFTPSQIDNYLLVLTVTAPDGQQQTANVSVNVSPAEPWKIVAIGDSITQSNLDHPSYRYRLWKKLIDGNYSFDFIGSQHVNSNETAGTATLSGPQVGQDDYKGETFDPDHEGYWGATAGQVAGRLQTSLPQLASADPDQTPEIALVHLGTNDLLLGSGSTADKVASALNGLTSVVARLREQNADVVIILAQIIPYAGDAGGEVQELNSAIAGFAAQPEINAVVVDQYSDFNPAVGADTFDSIHPNDSGEDKIAQKFFDELQKIMK